MMPLGLQRVMDKALSGVQDCAVAFIDDILIYSQSWDAHMTHLRRVLNALRQTGLTVKLKKSKLGQVNVQYLGFHIGHGKIWAVPDKVSQTTQAMHHVLPSRFFLCVPLADKTRLAGTWVRAFSVLAPCLWNFLLRDSHLAVALISLDRCHLY